MKKLLLIFVIFLNSCAVPPSKVEVIEKYKGWVIVESTYMGSFAKNNLDKYRVTLKKDTVFKKVCMYRYDIERFEVKDTIR